MNGFDCGELHYWNMHESVSRRFCNQVGKALYLLSSPIKDAFQSPKILLEESCVFDSCILGPIWLQQEKNKNCSAGTLCNY